MKTHTKFKYSNRRKSKKETTLKQKTRFNFKSNTINKVIGIDTILTFSDYKGNSIKELIKMIGGFKVIQFINTCRSYKFTEECIIKSIKNIKKSKDNKKP